MIFIEFHGYKDSMINYRLASKVTMSCAHELYTGPVYMGVIFTERKFQQAAVALKLFSPVQKDWLTGSFTHIVLEDYTEQELQKIDPR